MVKTRRLSALKTQREKWRIYDLSSPYVATTSTTKEAHEAMEIETTTPTDIGSCEPGGNSQILSQALLKSIPTRDASRTRL
ncbi:predicted protein [Coccidioides posadasii str. Silveira]|uniref:Predicted protein n=1 Tax=Coccidioides posadasii (strain RMSCC 757 / Silveira) TaxID=443226 RepID=E9DJX1_COCPS|nr:predicted protein [Coccidioides posadasii str. Silveira]